MKKRVESLVSNFWFVLFIIILVLMFISMFLFGFIGLVKVGSYFDLIDINLYPTTFSNVLYFGWLLILIYIFLIFIEIIVRLLMRNVAQSLKKNIISYSIQILMGTVWIKIIIDNYFDRIEVSLLSVCISVTILYLIIFFSSGGHKGIDDLEE